MNDLSQRMKDAVPTPPDLTDLSSIATRSAADGRRRRTQRRFASVAAVAVLAVGGVVLPRVLDDGPPDVTGRSEPQCVASPDAPLEAIKTQEATWFRFCPLPDDDPGPRLRVPPGAVVGGVAPFVVQGWTDWVIDRGCGPETPPVPRRHFRIQIGLGGGVTEIVGDTACVDDHLLYLQARTPLRLARRTRRDEVVEPRSVACPDVFGTTATSWDGADADLLRDDASDPSLSTVPLMPGQSSAVDVCAYTGQGDDRTLTDQWRSQSLSTSDIEATAMTGYRDGEADCETQPDATSYLVVMQDLTGTARSFTLDTTACNEMRAAIGTPAVDTYLGLATDELVRQVRTSKP